MCTCRYRIAIGKGTGDRGTTDLIFALDSIPAIFAVTRETFVVYAANAFSLLGLSAIPLMSR